MTHALVTGGAGLIGSHIVDLLIERGIEVTILDNLDPQTHPQGQPSWIPAATRFIQGDTRNADDWRRALDGVDIVFHQAAFGGFSPDYSLYLDSNAVGTARMFEVIAAYKLPIQKIVAASSQAIYGEGSYICPEHDTQYPQPRPLQQLETGEWELRCPHCNQLMTPARIAEDKPYDGKTAYAISKFATERLVLDLGKQIGIPSVALRYSVTYGPRQSIFNPYTGVVSIFSTRILNGIPPVIYEDGLQTRDFTFVEDIAAANLFCMDNPACDWQAFNAGAGQRITVRDLVETLMHSYGIDGLPVSYSTQFRPGDARHMVPDPSRLETMGWKAQITLVEGISRYVAWIKTQGAVKEYFTEAYQRLKAMQIVRQVKRPQ